MFELELFMRQGNLLKDIDNCSGGIGVLWTKSYSNIFFLFQLETKFLPYIQVNLCQKLSFMNQLTQNMTRDCSLNYKKNTSSEHVVYKYCFECQNKNKKKHFLYTTCSKVVFFGEFNEQSLVIFWVN